MKIFDNPDLLNSTDLHTSKVMEINVFMRSFMSTILRNFKVKGEENLKEVIPLLGKFPMVLISNHTSHLDTIVIYSLIASLGPQAIELANSLVFIASRLALETRFIRLGILTVDTLLVCSRRDMEEYPDITELMNKINLRSFRKTQQLQKKE